MLLLATLRRLSGRLRTGALHRALVVLLAAVATVAVTATAAQADTFNPGLTRDYTWNDCSIRVGVVPDVYSPPAAIGGVTVSCSRRHANVSASVSLKFNGSVVPGSTASTNFFNAYGFGGRILKTPRFCGQGSWQIVANVSVTEFGTGFVTNGTPQYWKAC